MAEQAALEAQGHLAIAGAHHERRHEVGDDVVVVAGVERDALLGVGLGNAEGDVERAIAVERRDLDRDHVVDRREPAPEGARQRNAAHRRLQVEADQRHLVGDRRAVLDQLVLVRALERSERQQDGVVAHRPRRPRLVDRLRGLADRAGDHHQRPVGPFARRLDRKLEHRPIEPDLADGELRRVHADRQAAGAGVDIVAADGALRLLVEPTVGTERQGMGGNHRTVAELRQDRCGEVVPKHGVSLSQFGPGEGEDMARIVETGR